LIWLLPVLLCLLSALYFFHVRKEGQGKQTATATPAAPGTKTTLTKQQAIVSASTAPLPLLGVPGVKTTNAVAASAEAAREARLKYRLSNTSLSVNELAHRDHAILLENALVDTARPANFSIPDGLRASGDPGAYIVQASGPIDAAFRALL